MRNYIYVCLLVLFVTMPMSVMAAKKSMTTYTWDSAISAQSTKPTSYLISFENDLGSFSFAPSTAGSVIKNNDKTVSLGNTKPEACGVLWYAGDTYCSQGICDFSQGFTAYFEFTADKDNDTKSYKYTDGFTFAVVNGTDNLSSFKNGTLRGGPPAGKSLGELLCYAGTGLDGIGIQAPKFAVEFDTGPSAGKMADYGCNCAGVYRRCNDGTCGTSIDDCPIPWEQGRADNSTNNHIAVMFWGNDNSGYCGSTSVAGNTVKNITYDDNTHGEGNGKETNPLNSAGGSTGYCERSRGTKTYHWMEDGAKHYVRIEVKRTKANRTYDIKAWVDCQDPCCSISLSSSCPTNSCDMTKFKDVTLDYYTNNEPKIKRTVTLSDDLNTKFNNMIFGFTVGSGSITQTVKIENFKLYFLH